jgi:hypothetical protein
MSEIFIKGDGAAGLPVPDADCDVQPATSRAPARITIIRSGRGRGSLNPGFFIDTVMVPLFLIISVLHNFHNCEL